MYGIQTDKLIAEMNSRIAFKEASPDSLRILVPFFHEDGDMYDIFLRLEGDSLQICDFGMTLMHLSYKTDLDTDGKMETFSKIISNNGVAFDRGNLIMPTSYETFFTDLMQYQIAVSKVSNLEILKRETLSNLFLEHFSSFISNRLGQTYQNIQAHFHPTNEAGYEVDFAILDKKERPIYIMAVKDSISALRATALCLRVSNLGTKHTSIAVHDKSASIAARDKDALTNAVDKQYTSLTDFECHAEGFIARQIA